MEEQNARWARTKNGGKVTKTMVVKNPEKIEGKKTKKMAVKF